jgi:hypothetical protein
VTNRHVVLALRGDARIAGCASFFEKPAPSRENVFDPVGSFGWRDFGNGAAPGEHHGLRKQVRLLDRARPFPREMFSAAKEKSS